MNSQIFIIEKEEEINQITDYLLNKIQKVKLPCLIQLSGDLGAGKTTFVKYFLKDLGLKEEVNSPTFAKMHEYKLENYNIYHLDFYRDCINENELEEIFLDNKAIIFIEWLENLYEKNPEIKLPINFKIQIKVSNNNLREITFSSF